MTAMNFEKWRQYLRARLLEAATVLLRSGGPSAVTIDAVTRHANVARATLYRHFPSSNDLVAAAFMSLIPTPPMPPAEGTLRERLIAVVGEWAGAREGLAVLINLARGSLFDIPLMFATLVTIALVGVALYLVVVAAERRFVGVR